MAPAPEEGKSWLDVGPSTNGQQGTAEHIDTSSWFESQLPPAAEQPEAKIELTTLGGPSVPTPPSIAEATQEAREISSGPDVTPPPQS